MPASLFVDSGAWLAFFSARDGRHAEADRLVREALRRTIPLVTTDLVVGEVHRLLLHRAGIAAAAAALDVLDRSPSVTIEFLTPRLHEDARAWLARLDDQVITYTDAASFAVMKAQRCRAVLGFDRDFMVAGFPIWAGER